MSGSSSYQETMAWCVAALVLKNMVNHLLVIRCRMATRDMNQPVSPEGDPSQWYGQFLFPIFRHMMGGSVGPFRSKQDLARLLAMENNAAQNETYFMVLAMLWPNAGIAMPDWASMALTIFTYSRFAHFVFFVFIRMQPTRALAYFAGFVVNCAIAINILQGVGGSK